MIYSKVYQEGMKALEQAGIVEAKVDARMLLESVCHTSYTDLYAHGDREVTEEEQKLYEEYLSRRQLHEPLQQIIGECEFMGLTFKVSRDVLTPRQDTENLVEEVMKELHDGMRILDMCTGSGCIILSLLHYSNDCQGVAVDLSEEALKIARANGERLGEKVEWIRSDLFSDLEGKFDRIVSNPPYIASGEIDGLMTEVRDFEPRMALDGKEDGLFFYRKIIDEAREYLYHDGMLYFEIGYDQGQSVSRLMKDAGFVEVNVVRDFVGNDRIVYGTYIG